MTKEFGTGKDGARAGFWLALALLAVMAAGCASVVSFHTPAQFKDHKKVADPPLH